MKVTHDLVNCFLHAEKFVGKEIKYFEFLALKDALEAGVLFEIDLDHALLRDHVIESFVREFMTRRVLAYLLKILEHVSLPC